MKFLDKFAEVYKILTMKNYISANLKVVHPYRYCSNTWCSNHPSIQIRTLNYHYFSTIYVIASDIQNNIWTIHYLNAKIIIHLTLS